MYAIRNHTQRYHRILLNCTYVGSYCSYWRSVNLAIKALPFNCNWEVDESIKDLIATIPEFSLVKIANLFNCRYWLDH